MSELTKTEQETVAECTKLMEKYIEYYSTANSDAIGSLYAAPYAAAVGDDYMNMEGISAEDVGKGQVAYFEARKGHWHPPESTQVSVRPINNASALAQIRWVFPATHSGNQYNIFSMYLCVKTENGWKMKFATQPVDSGHGIVTENSSYKEWDFDSWEIYKG